MLAPGTQTRGVHRADPNAPHLYDNYKHTLPRALLLCIIKHHHLGTAWLEDTWARTCPAPAPAPAVGTRAHGGSWDTHLGNKLCSSRGNWLTIRLKSTWHLHQCEKCPRYSKWEKAKVTKRVFSEVSLPGGKSSGRIHRTLGTIAPSKEGAGARTAVT